MRPLLPLLLLALAAPATAQEILYSTEGNRLRRFDVDTFTPGPVLADVLVERVSGAEGGGGPPVGKRRDINGMVCALPGDAGLLLAGEDTAQPHPPAGWGVLTPDGLQVGKLTATVLTDTPDPYGCAVDASYEGECFLEACAQAGEAYLRQVPSDEIFPVGPLRPDRHRPLLRDLGPERRRIRRIHRRRQGRQKSGARHRPCTPQRSRWA